MKLNPDKLRLEFPALQQSLRGRSIVYLDNACTTVPPQSVIQAVSDYYSRFPGCHARASHFFGRKVTEYYEKTRQKLQLLINAGDGGQIILLPNTTTAVNLVANGIGLKNDECVLCSNIEHNSNLLPWQIHAKKGLLRHRVFELRQDNTFDMGRFAAAFSPDVRLVSVVHRSNVTGVALPIKQICDFAHERGAIVFVDAAQSVPERAVDVMATGVDLLAFSMHKAYGPSGVGALYARDELLHTMEPLLVGGEGVEDTTYDRYIPSVAPARFEVGLQNYAGIVGSGVAADFLMQFSVKDIHDHLQALNALATQELLKLPGVMILGPADPALRGSICNFVLDGVDSYDVASLLDEYSNIMVRPGKSCVHSWFNATKTPDSVRVSFALYNTLDDVEILVEGIKRIRKNIGGVK